MYEQKSDNPIAEVNAFNFVPETIQLANFGSSHGQYAFDWGLLKIVELNASTLPCQASRLNMIMHC